MSDGDPLIKQAGRWAGIVPVLLVADLQRSVDVYTRLLGMATVHSEPAQFAELELPGGRLVLRQYVPGDPAVTAELTQPFGRGLTLNIRMDDPKALYESLRAEQYPIAVPMELAELSAGGETFTQASFVVADPDGYLLRFSD